MYQRMLALSKGLTGCPVDLIGRSHQIILPSKSRNIPD